MTLTTRLLRDGNGALYSAYFDDDGTALKPVQSGASGGASPATTTARLLSAAASTNATSVKTAAGTVTGAQGYNASATAKYLKLYDKASAPTVGTDTPRKTLILPPLAAFAYDFPSGIAFAGGVAFALTGAAADNDTTALAAGDVTCLNLDYL